MISLTLTSYGSTLSGHVNIDGFVLSSKLASVYENISSLSNNYLDCDSCGNLYSNSFRLAIEDITSNSYTAYSIVLYTVVSSVKKAVAYYSSDQPIIVKESSDHIHKFIQFSNLGGSIASISLQSISSSSRSSDNNTDGVVHIEDDSTSLDDSYSVYSKSQVDSLLSSIYIPTKLSDLTNDVGYITNSSLPAVNNSTITIQKNSSTVDSFTTNASSNKTINISVPTNASDLTNDSGFITTSDLPESDYLSLIGKSVTIGAIGEVGVVYQPLSDLMFQHYESTPNYSSLNSDLVTDGWTLSSTWKSIGDSFIYNNAICYKGTPTGGSSSYYYKSITETSAYTMSQLENAIVKSGHSAYTFETDSNNSITLTYGDPEYDSAYPNRKFVYNKSSNKFNIYGTGIETGVVQVPTWLYNAINSYDSTIYDSSSWIFSCGMGFEYSQDPVMNGGNLYTICASNTTYYINSYSFSEYDMYSGLWHRTSMWNSETLLPYGGSESGWFIAIQEDVYTMSNYEYPNGNWVEYSTNIYYNSDNEYMYQYYDSNSGMYGSDPYNCYNTFMGGVATLTSTNYYHIFCTENQFGAFASNGGNSSWSGGTV